jgi:hypothetical protein
MEINRAYDYERLAAGLELARFLKHQSKGRGGKTLKAGKRTSDHSQTAISKQVAVIEDVVAARGTKLLRLWRQATELGSRFLCGVGRKNSS